MTALAKNTRVLKMRPVPRNGTIVLPGAEITTLKISTTQRLLVVKVTGEAPVLADLNAMREALSQDGLRATFILVGPETTVEVTEEVPGAA